MSVLNKITHFQSIKQVNVVYHLFLIITHKSISQLYREECLSWCRFHCSAILDWPRPTDPSWPVFSLFSSP